MFRPVKDQAKLIAGHPSHSVESANVLSRHNPEMPIPKHVETIRNGAFTQRTQDVIYETHPALASLIRQFTTLRFRCPSFSDS